MLESNVVVFAPRLPGTEQQLLCPRRDQTRSADIEVLQRISVWLTHNACAYIRSRRRVFTQPLVHAWHVWVNINAKRSSAHLIYEDQALRIDLRSERNPPGSPQPFVPLQCPHTPFLG